MLLPEPLHQIDEPPAHHPVEIGNRAFLDRRDKRLALLVVQQRRTVLGLSSVQTVWPSRLKRSTQSRMICRPTPPIEAA